MSSNRCHLGTSSLVSWRSLLIFSLQQSAFIGICGLSDQIYTLVQFAPIPLILVIDLHNKLELLLRVEYICFTVAFVSFEGYFEQKHRNRRSEVVQGQHSGRYMNTGGTARIWTLESDK
jgi:hypothetical protein